MRATRNERAVLCRVLPRARSNGLPSSPRLELSRQIARRLEEVSMASFWEQRQGV